MDSFKSSPLREWRLETTYPGSKIRNHQLPSGDECWQAVTSLGNGTFGDVWKERCVSGPSQNAVRAVKQLRKRQSKSLEMSRRELDALVTFSDSHKVEYKQHFVQFRGWFEDDTHFYIAMEFVDNGDLQKYITTPFPEHEAASIVTQIARALQYMHQKNFIHRDIKPLNILVSSPGPNWHVKVADFGIAKMTDGAALGTQTHFIGTPGYMAPELYGDSLDGYTTAVDVWALGAVAFCLRTCSPPFRTIPDLLDYGANRRQFPIRVLGMSSGFCMSFVLGTMADRPERRPKIQEVLTHDWLLGQSEAPEGGGSGVNSATGLGTWSTSPSNTWLSTYDCTSNQQLQVVSPLMPVLEQEFASLPLPKPPISLQGQASEVQLSREIANLATVSYKVGKNDNTKNITPEVPGDNSENSKRVNVAADLATKYRHQREVNQEVLTMEQAVSSRPRWRLWERISNMTTALIPARQSMPARQSKPAPESRQQDVRVRVRVFVLDHKNELILGQRNGSAHHRTWDLPGGHLKSNENWEGCAVNKVKENTGLDIKNVQFFTITNDIMPVDQKHYVTVFLGAKMKDENAQPLLLKPEKWREWRWVGWEELRKDMDCQIVAEMEGRETEGRRLSIPLVSLFEQRGGARGFISSIESD